MVKGTKQQVEQVKNIVAQIESNGPNVSLLGDQVKFYPNTGRSAAQLLEQAQLLFETQNRGIKINVRQSGQDEQKQNGRSVKLGAGALPKESRADTTSPNETSSDVRDAKSGEQPTEDGKSTENKVQMDAPKSDAAESGTPKDEAADKPKANQEQTGVPSALHHPIRSGRFVQANADEATADDADANDAISDEEDLLKNESGDESEEEPTPNDSQKTIEIIETPNGLIVTSEDPKLLAEFEQMSMLLNEQMANSPTQPTIYYLKYVPAAPAAELIKQAMSGQVSASGGGGLLGDVASNVLGGFGGNLVGGLLGGGGSSSTSVSGPPLASGEVSIIPDVRLNYLIIHANNSDLQTIDQLLEVIDQEDSPLLVETKGKPQIIELQYADATEVATMVKEAFASRIAGAQAGGNRAPQNPQDIFAEAIRSAATGNRGGNNRGSQAAQMPEQTMTISVHTRNNAIVVTGPRSLYEEVKSFVEMIDQGSIENQEDVQVVTIDGNVTAVQNALRSILGPQSQTMNHLAIVQSID